MFKHRVNAVCIIVRRKADEMAMLKALEEAGYAWVNGKKPTEISAWDKVGSRVIHFRLNGMLFAASPAGAIHKRANDVRKDMADHMVEYHEINYDDIKFINTKPSVSEAITELKKYI